MQLPRNRPSQWAHLRTSLPFSSCHAVPCPATPVCVATWQVTFFQSANAESPRISDEKVTCHALASHFDMASYLVRSSSLPGRHHAAETDMIRPTVRLALTACPDFVSGAVLV